MPRKYPPGTPCSQCGRTDRPIHARGLCNPCYCDWRYSRIKSGEITRPRREPCRVPGCERPRVAREMCQTHYTRFRKGRMLVQPVLDKAPASTGTCRFCDKHVHAHGLCLTHYMLDYRKDPTRLEQRREIDRRYKARKREAKKAADAEGNQHPRPARRGQNTHAA